MNRCRLAVPVGHPVREYPDWIQATLLLDDRLGHRVQHDQPFLSVLHARSLFLPSKPEGIRSMLMSNSDTGIPVPPGEHRDGCEVA